MSDSEKRDDNGGRDPATGRFVAGNGGGGRKKMDPEVRKILEAADADSARALVAGLQATKFVGLEMREVPDWKERREYAVAIHDRLHGKPAVAITDEEGNARPLGVLILPAEKG